MFSRIDRYRWSFQDSHLPEVTLFAGENVAFDQRAVRELRQMLEVQGTMNRWSSHAPEAFPEGAGLQKVVLTPDFHKAKGIPVGTVVQTRGFLLPQAVGNDVGCGMRLHTTSLTAEQVLGHQKALIPKLRRMFFEAGRNIPMNRLQREALLREGLLGLMDTTPRSLQEGLWQLFHDQDLTHEAEHTESLGSRRARNTLGLEDFLGQRDFTRDGQIGSLGGGNHFVEIQRVKNILHPGIAHAWGLRKDQVVVMVHSGSVSVGYTCASMIREHLSRLYPAGLVHPRNQLYPVPNAEVHEETVLQNWDALNAGCNFATANRLMLALMVRAVFQDLEMPTDFPLLYDATHNMIWEEDGTYIHRKGATPARGFEAMQNTPFRFTGEPVLVPGSMGTSSFVLAGLGLREALSSASHGAGRVLSRGQAMQGSTQDLDDLLRQHRVVTPVDFARTRPDVAREKLKELLQEAPDAYKNIQAIMETLQGAQIAQPVAELEPLITVKG
ncbi:RtcB family protein [Deinococcus cellulosilyticus]|uniref:tRNA-splicing ligase RtcB n=1 Tax=Deinococcus cellulosilyticus (strain DSM 18568 / NBRC 106333 / KACC 11606 / 5516J-15) TaxID=1223518 RepID=A0A511NBK7_DEIC1|nr:RtcB family protein [Deinococcus cellulosilyticus]GEM49751.1 RNA-splicing ligase RtcB [Deinococcus cellulosilyticus NBRC 106333 = KACC 11606]